MSVTVRSGYLAKWHQPRLADVYELLYATAHLEIRTGCGTNLRLGTVARLDSTRVDERCTKCYGDPNL